MDTPITTNNLEDNHSEIKVNRETGTYWVRIDDAWFLTKYYSRNGLFYFPGYFDGFAQKELIEIDERRLEKKFEGHKRKTFDNVEQSKPVRQEGYYWVLHDAMWFATYYLSSKDEFFFPGQIYGFDPPQLDEIDERRIERQLTILKRLY